LFTDARSHGSWTDAPVDDALLVRLYELVRLGPTSGNSQPIRLVFVKSAEAKERLRPALWPTNVEKAISAPVTVIVAHDQRFHEHMPKLFPMRPDMGERIASMGAESVERFALQSATLQAGYLVIAARALGLDCGPMGGFDAAAVDAAFLAGTSWRSTLLVNLGHGRRDALPPRLPRLSFDEACRIA
jgi:3-hydroxypropanoate dehydrogenase